MNQTVWIARHGTRLDFIDLDWFNRAERPYDPPLAPEGKVEAKQLGERLKTASIAHIFASPFLRTVQTAHIIAEILDLPVKLEAGFSEWHNPDWMWTKPEILPLESLAAKYPRIDCSYNSHLYPQYPETETQLNQRVANTINRLITDFADDFLIIGHGPSVVATAKALLSETPQIKASFCCLIGIQRLNQDWKLLQILTN